MLKLFNKTRQNSIFNGNMVKYLKYAFGEIVLVVLGILIAVQINNWNLERAALAVEINLLEGIRDDILRDTIDINMNIRGHKNMVRTDSILLNHLMTKKPYDPEIAYFLVNTLASYNLTLHGSHFEEIKLRGESTITNEQLKEAISRLYEFDYVLLMKTLEDIESINLREKIFDKVSNYVSFKDSRYYLSESMYEKLITDNQYLILKQYDIILRKMTLFRHQQTLDKALEVKDAIEEELKKKK